MKCKIQLRFKSLLLIHAVKFNWLPQVNNFYPVELLRPWGQALLETGCPSVLASFSLAGLWLKHAFDYSTCWDLLNRWISSMNRMVFLLHSRSSFCACLMTSRTSLMDALVADREAKRAVPFFLLVLDIIRAKVVWKERKKHTNTKTQIKWIWTQSWANINQ